MSDDETPSKAGTIEQGADGSVTIFAPAATLHAGVRAPAQGRAAEAEEPLSAELTRVVRHLNGLAVAVEALRMKVIEREKAGNLLRFVPKE